MLLTHIINKPAEVVFNFLADTGKFVSVHPVITKMKPLENNKFLVFETLKAGFLSHSFTYTVIIEADKENNKIVMTAIVMKRTRIKMTFTITESNSYTLINEEIIFHSWLPIKSLMQRIFKKQHILLFENIANSRN